MKNNPNPLDNPLDRALRLAADDAANRPDFYRLLLQSEVLVVGDAAETDDGNRLLEAGSIKKWKKPDGSLFVPFFTSQAAAQQAIKGQAKTQAKGAANCLPMPARQLFETTRGSTLFLNPNLKYGKQLLPKDIDTILAGGVPSTATAKLLPGQDEFNVVLTQPKKYPTRMVDALTKFFAKRSQVKAAYVGQMKFDQASGKAARLILGIYADGDFDHLVKEVVAVISDTASRSERLNLYPIAPGQEGVAAYFFDYCKPFYESSWGSRLDSTIEPGHA